MSEDPKEEEGTPADLLAFMREKFQGDLDRVFGERGQDFGESLKDLLFEFWTAAANSTIQFHPDEEAVMRIVRKHFVAAGGLRVGDGGIIEESPDPQLKESTHLELSDSYSRPAMPSAGNGAVWIKDDAPNTLMFTDDGGTDHVLTGKDATNVGDELQKLYEQGVDPLQDALSSKGLPDSYMMVPVMMHKGTGQVFGVDVTNRQKYVPTQRIVHLTNSDGGFTWEFDVAYQPPSHQDPNATHVLIRVDGVVKTAPSDYTVNTTGYGNDEAVESIRFIFGQPGVEVTATFSDVATDYF